MSDIVTKFKNEMINKASEKIIDRMKVELAEINPNNFKVTYWNVDAILFQIHHVPSNIKLIMYYEGIDSGIIVCLNRKDMIRYKVLPVTFDENLHVTTGEINVEEYNKAMDFACSALSFKV